MLSRGVQVEVNEVATRLVRRYWSVLLVAVLLPVVAVGVFVNRQHSTYTAHARILAATTTPRAQAEAAALVSQVQAIATSRDPVAAALKDGNVTAEPTEVVKNITVTGLGTSAIVDLAYTDQSALKSQQITAVLAKAITKQLDDVRIGGLPDVLKNIDDQLTDLASKRAPLAAAAQANPHDLVAINRLAGMDRLISDLSGDRNRLAEQAAAAGHAAVVTSPVVPLDPDPKGLAAKLAIAALLGLALGLIIVGVNEVMRPAVSGATRVGRLLDVPMLGIIQPNPAALADVGRRIRLAARRADVTTVVLVRATRAALTPELVDRIEAATLRPDTVASRIAIPIGSRPGPVDGTATMVIADDSPTQVTTSLALLTVKENSRPARENSNHAHDLRRVCALDELDPGAEADKIGMVVLVAANTRLTSVDAVRDLLAASGWPLLGVLGDGGQKWGKK
jgi:capsular polysaccharide biosynthesis protein